MSKIGFSKPKFAKYAAAGGVVSYSGGGSMGYGTSAEITINSTEDNNLAADNTIVAADRRFAGGNIVLGTSELSNALSKAICGITPTNLPTIPGITDTGVKELIYNDDANPPYLGIGLIFEEHRDNPDPDLREIYYRAIILKKVMFSVPGMSARTRPADGTIEWLTPELNATIMRDDSAKHEWKREAEFSTEAQAEIYLNYMLNIDQPGPNSNNEVT